MAASSTGRVADTRRGFVHDAVMTASRSAHAQRALTTAMLSSALLGCADAQPSAGSAAGSSASIAQPASTPSATAVASATATAAPSSHTVATSASASAAKDVSLPDDPPTPSASASASVRTPITVADAAAMEEIVKDFAKLAGSLRSRPSDGGMKVTKLRSDSALAKLGIREGDVLVTINGFSMAEPDEAVDAYAKLRRAKRMDILVLRDGVQHVFSVEIRRR